MNLYDVFGDDVFVVFLAAFCCWLLSKMLIFLREKKNEQIQLKLWLKENNKQLKVKNLSPCKWTQMNAHHSNYTLKNSFRLFRYIRREMFTIWFYCLNQCDISVFLGRARAWNKTLKQKRAHNIYICIIHAFIDWVTSFKDTIFEARLKRSGDKE